jgi:hypothetical protein
MARVVEAMVVGAGLLYVLGAVAGAAWIIVYPEKAHYCTDPMCGSPCC